MRISSERTWPRAVFAILAAAITLIAAPSAAQTQTAGLTPRQEFLKKLVAAAEERTHHTVRYDPAYVRIPYPDGDVPEDTGVCTDEVIRSPARLESTCRKKSTRTWKGTSRLID